jgi:hypothetical protein
MFGPANGLKIAQTCTRFEMFGLVGDTKVSQERTASIFGVEKGGNKFLRNVGV